MEPCVRGSGVEVLFPNNWYESNPKCDHGPMLMFERFVKGKVEKRFFACSACRDRKRCKAFVHENNQLHLDKDNTSMVKAAEDSSNLLPLLPTYEEILACDQTQRVFCITCQKIILKLHSVKDHPCKNHQLKEGISIETIKHASRLLYAPLECDTKNAQYFLTEECTNIILATLKRLKFSRVLCIGMPTLHENIQSLRQSEGAPMIDSMLLDIDSRFKQSNQTGSFCHFNMFNHHIFDNTFNYLKTFMTNVKESELVIVLDPPFGGLVDAISETLKWIFQLYWDLNQSFLLGTPANPNIMWIFPYFMERRVCDVYSSMKMLDYQVHYENHKKFKRRSTSNRLSPVRIFTTIELEKFILPYNEGYRFCKICRRFVYRENTHCTKCNSCTSKDGRSYVHCDSCAACFKPGWVHCKTCKRCRPFYHECHIISDNALAGCHHCGKLSHKRKNCPMASRPATQTDKAMEPICVKRHSNKAFHSLSSHTKKSKWQ